jgi:hypothetical protein
MQPGIVQKIFKDHFPNYYNSHNLHSRQTKAAQAIMTCRTAGQGYHINACPNGDYRDIVFNSCKHRSCPQCGATDTQQWLERRKAKALDCPYFHVVFTIDHQLHIIWRYNRRLFTNLMMQAAWHSLRELLLDWRYLGGLVGAVAAFQSWDDELYEHCHIHFIVTAGGINDDGRWVRSGNILVPTPVLAAKFRGKFLAYLKAAFSRYTRTGQPKPAEHVLLVPGTMRKQQCLNLLNKLGRKRWHADIEPAYAHANGVFKYVGRYIRRGPISEKRIVGYDGQIVTIAYAHGQKHKHPTFQIAAKDFITRLLTHAPAKGTHVVRSYGLFHPNCLKKLNLARRLLGQVEYRSTQELPSAMALLRKMFPKQSIGLCPYCASELRTVFIYRGGRPAVVRPSA